MSTKSRNHTGTLFIAYTMKPCKHKIRVWASDNIATFDMLFLSIAA